MIPSSPHSHRNGFTLVEVLIAIAVFSVIVTIGVGGFVHALHTQREVAALIAAQTNMSVVLEQMTREMRTGYLFCNTPTNNGNPNPTCQLSGNNGCTINGNVWTCNNLIDFYNAQQQNVDYELQNGAIVRSASGPTGTFVPVTGNNVLVKYLTFTLFGNTEGDNWSPRVTISLGIAPNSNDPVLANDVLNLQTTVSARTIDCTQTGPLEC